MTLTQRVASIGVLGMLLIAFATIADVLSRWLFATAVTGMEEMASMALAVAVSACLPAGAAQRVNVTVDLLSGRLGARTVSALQTFGALLLLVFYALLALRVGDYARDLGSRGGTTIYLGLPVAPFLWVVAGFLAATTAVQALVIFTLVRRWASGVALLAAAAAALVALELAFPSLSALAKGAPGWTSLIVVLAVWLLLASYVPLAAALGLLGVLGTALMIGEQPALSVLGSETAQFLTNEQVAVVPMFLMMGSFAVVAGMAEDIYDLAHALLAPLRGGLALATIGGCGGFGALTGSSLATVATIGRVALPEMTARGYAPSLTSGCIAAGGTLGALVPPSIPLIFYAFLTETSIGQLFIAAMIPAALAVALYMAAVSAFVRVSPQAAPPAAARIDWTQVGRATRKAWAALALFGVVLGGIYGGVFTETEAAAVGAAGAFAFALARGRMNRESFARVMGETTATTALLYLIIFGVLVFSFSMGVTGLPQRMTSFFQDLDWRPVAVIGLLLAMYIALGCIMDSNTVMFVTIPIVSPLVSSMGYDLIWWGVVNLVVLETGLITPPFGIHLFVLKGIVGADVPLSQVYRGVAPFVIADFARLALLVLFPALALWLPSTMAR
ncbi:MAG TPA: TRAP transporter large permease [Burkholderiales bacterium]